MNKYIGAVISAVVAIAVVIGLIAILGQVGYFDHPQVYGAPSSSSSSASAVKHVTLTLETLPASPYDDPGLLTTLKSLVRNGDSGNLQSQSSPQVSPPGAHLDWVTYWPTTRLVVPANSLVTVTIYNWDSMSPLLNDYYARPIGTTNAQGVADNSETVTTYDNAGKPVVTTYNQQHPADPATVSHTFTLRSIPGSKAPYMFVSVPDIGVADNAETDDAGFPKQPIINTFSFMTKGPGVYAWNCFDPCGSRFDSFGGPMQTYGYMSGTLVVQ